MNVVLLALPYCAASSLHGLLDILATANYAQGRTVSREAPPLFALDVVTPDDKPVSAFNGSAIVPTIARNQVQPDLLITASAIESVTSTGFLDRHLAAQTPIYAWLQELSDRGVVLATACTGSFVLAEAGLLEGKTVTTHWRSADHFRSRYPQVHLEADKMLIDNGDIISAGGATAFIDLALYIIERFASPTLASACAKLHVFDNNRQDQAPYRMFSGFKSHKDERIKQAQDWMETHYHEQFSVDDVAGQVGLGARTFKRRFKEATGETPIAYLQQVRVEAVKTLLETTNRSFGEIIWEAGYEDVSSFRRLFKRATGCTMEQYRRRFSYVVPPEIRLKGNAPGRSAISQV